MEYLMSLYEKWGQLARWQKWLIILLVGILLFFILYYIRILPLKQELNEKKQKAEQLRLTVSRLKIVEKRKKELVRKIKELNREIEEIENKLPTGREEVSQIIKSITDADSGMTIKFIKKEGQRNERYYIAYPYKVELSGTYPAFIKWCERLASANRIINFGDIKITSTHSTNRRGKREENLKATILVNMEIEAFTLKR
ncbi:type IV pilus assembly protein PilO [Thermovibrio guaymasensis]|uniref:Type IV pilus assembly protein PilO n=1 Tax=Thermovibrio guaymasensis TaxID=240167 RepID=A0A420W8X4_9BACT|nr:type 4a pilus biogenesis protein PilO [Thermovibrio guaymasensis]RKQ63773.1 type IV pilus assembly protein PilO [Thermovibrio guaymasensis]